MPYDGLIFHPKSSAPLVSGLQHQEEEEEEDKDFNFSHMWYMFRVRKRHYPMKNL
jgi:hypothetical protein